MSPLENLGFILGTSFASGLNLYATMAVAGLLQRFELVDLPPAWGVLANPVILGLTLTLFVVEFLADKIPWVDSAWDAVHTFIRPPAAAALAFGAMGGLGEPWSIGAALLAGTVALTSHGAKASTRAAANASPEPFSNWILSFAEDAVAVGLTWMATTHPVVTALIVVVLLVLAVLLLRAFHRALTTLRDRLRAAFSPPPAPPPAG
ncbi:MAG TPA: DUF4126 domain-containing protein [Gemmatimonadales bacterium]|nr:DUF4126 domain-containing protein [Gemmatimonadales bacterium]